ncbi:MAG: hypothetical protein WD022_02960, partial [Balneolaceae bacterium]
KHPPTLTKTVNELHNIYKDDRSDIDEETGTFSPKQNLCTFSAEWFSGNSSYCKKGCKFFL